MRKRLPANLKPLLIILISIIVVFLFARSVTYLILVNQVLPKYLFLNLNGFRLHHFVYGNILIVLTGFISIGLGVRKHKNLFALFYGIGLGLVLDEFVLWIGDTRHLNSLVLWIPHSLTVISIVVLVIASIVMHRLYFKK